MEPPMDQEHLKDATIQEFLDGKNAVRQQLPKYPIWILVAEQPPLQKGDHGDRDDSGSDND
jgi:hypothetical protein